MCLEDKRKPPCARYNPLYNTPYNRHYNSKHVTSLIINHITPLITHFIIHLITHLLPRPFTYANPSPNTASTLTFSQELLELFKHHPPTSDTILINALFDVGKAIHDAVDSLTAGTFTIHPRKCTLSIHPLKHPVDTPSQYTTSCIFTTLPRPNPVLAPPYLPSPLPCSSPNLPLTLS